MAVIAALRKAVFLGLPSVLLALAILELGGLALLVPVDDVPIEAWDASSAMIRYRPQQTGVTFPDGDRRHPVRYTVNENGWNSVHPRYAQERAATPRIAVVGDSYVAAFQVEPAESLSGRLEALATPQPEVYAFGMNGAPLSQHLHVTRHVLERYRPDAVAIVLVHNDFDESFRHIDGRYTASFLRLNVGERGVEEVEPVPYEGAPLFDFVRVRSATFRFFFYRLRLGSQAIRSLYFRFAAGEAPRYEANVDVTSLRAEDERLERATRYVFGELARLERESMTPIVLLMDAPRDPLYRGQDPAGTEAYRLNRLAASAAADTGLQLVDLTAAFARDWAEHRHRFEFPTDGHWNARGHAVAARELCAALARRSDAPVDACEAGPG